MSQAHWGFHMIIDAARCVPASIRDPKHIAKFATTLVNRIDMVAYGKPQVVHFGTGNKMGYTLVQLIETSNITAHFSEETNDAYIDVFSCKDFNKEDVRDVVKQFFGPEVMHERFLYRDAKCDKNCLK
jgi:S-adenosylmethionine/arginine decarboxylase-like enzyme